MANRVIRNIGRSMRNGAIIGAATSIAGNITQGVDGSEPMAVQHQIMQHFEPSNPLQMAAIGAGVGLVHGLVKRGMEVRAQHEILRQEQFNKGRK